MRPHTSLPPGRCSTERKLKIYEECVGVLSIKLGIFLRGPNKTSRADVDEAFLDLDDTLHHLIAERGADAA